MKKSVLIYSVLILYLFGFISDKCFSFEKTSSDKARFPVYYNGFEDKNALWQLKINDIEISENAKNFAEKHNCKAITKSYHWSQKIYKDAAGSVYKCYFENRDCKYILERGNKIRFAYPIEKHKFYKPVYGD